MTDTATDTTNNDTDNEYEHKYYPWQKHWSNKTETNYRNFIHKQIKKCSTAKVISKSKILVTKIPNKLNLQVGKTMFMNALKTNIKVVYHYVRYAQ